MKTPNTFLIKLENIVAHHLSNPNFSVKELSQQMDLSRMQLHRKIHQLTGANTSTFIKNKRLEASISLLKDKDKSVAEVAYDVGFTYPNYFSICFLKKYGVTPSFFKRMNKSNLG